MKKASTHIKPEWIRIPEAILVSGLCRSSIYELITDGKLESFSHTHKGSKRGVRLISYDSLIQFLDRSAKRERASRKALPTITVCPPNVIETQAPQQEADKQHPELEFIPLDQTVSEKTLAYARDL
jgi:hypothetical protein